MGYSEAGCPSFETALRASSEPVNVSNRALRRFMLFRTASLWLALVRVLRAQSAHLVYRGAYECEEASQRLAVRKTMSNTFTGSQGEVGVVSAIYESWY